jgi:GNAT superfamily N-acetyltransferase
MPPETGPHITIRRPRDAEGPACRMLLPEDRPGGAARTFLVAAQEGASPILGAACFRGAANALHSVRLRVIRTHRGHGIGTRLLEAVMAEARARGLRALITRVDAKAEPDALRFLDRHGFVRRGRLWVVEADAQRIHDHLTPLRQRLLAARGMPEGISILKFAEAPQQEVARLYAEHIAGHPTLQPELILDAMSNQRVDASPVLMVGGRAEGVLLWSLEGVTAHVHAWVVTPGHRDTYASPLLLAQAIQDACAAGARRIRFEFADNNRNTARVARRYGADTLKVLERFVLDVAPILFT